MVLHYDIWRRPGSSGMGEWHECKEHDCRGHDCRAHLALCLCLSQASLHRPTCHPWGSEPWHFLIWMFIISNLWRCFGGEFQLCFYLSNSAKLGPWIFTPGTSQKYTGGLLPVLDTDLKEFLLWGPRAILTFSTGTPRPPELWILQHLRSVPES